MGKIYSGSAKAVIDLAFGDCPPMPKRKAVADHPFILNRRTNGQNHWIGFDSKELMAAYIVEMQAIEAACNTHATYTVVKES